MTRRNGHAQAARRRRPLRSILVPRDEGPDLGRAFVLMSAAHLARRERDIRRSSWRSGEVETLVSLAFCLALALVLAWALRGG